MPAHLDHGQGIAGIQTKAFIIHRDRPAYAKRCASALRFAGLDVTIVDHGSTWRPALAWLSSCKEQGIRVLHHGGGHHPRDLWGWGPFRELCGPDKYLVTDCDVVPSADCPYDWAERLSGLLDAHPEFAKAAMGLRIDNLPAHYAWRDKVISWEQQFWVNQIADGVFNAIADTTLAVYKPLDDVPVFTMGAVRTGPPYVADHLPWHENLDDLAPELRYYHEHAEPGITFWKPDHPQAP